jgi:uncharacterized membrane protein
MTDTQDAHQQLSCDACRILDRADGVEDGKIFTPAHIPVKNESKLVHGLLRTQDRVADQVTAFAGSLRFVYLHGIWFGIWILLNVGLIGAGAEFDKFPFGLLTMIVSLEAIFLSTFVMVSQNRQAARSDIRAQLDFENNLRAEIWSVHVGAKLGIDPIHVEAVVTEALIAFKDAGA